MDPQPAFDMNCVTFNFSVSSSTLAIRIDPLMGDCMDVTKPAEEGRL